MKSRKMIAENPHVRFDEGEVAPCTAEASLWRVRCRRQPEAMTRPQVASRSEVAGGLRASVCAATPRRGSLLYKAKAILAAIMAMPLFAVADAVRVYDVDDYVQDGLVVHFDGIRNAGSDVAHDPGAATWKNLVADKPDMVFINSPGAWANGNSYYFNQISTAYGQLESGVTLGKYATVQLAVDVKANEQYSSNDAYPTYFYGPTDSRAFSLYSQGQGTKITFRGGKYFGGSDSDTYRPYVNSWGGQYLTAILGDGTDYALEGVEYANGKTRGASATSLPEFKYMFGGFDTANRAVKGAYYNVRLYNKVLSEAELEWNRNIDEQRFHEETPPSLDDVNVTLRANITLGDCVTDYVGKYIAEESHTFVPPATTICGEKYYALQGYALEKWNGSEWSGAVTNAGAASYTALADAKVRVTWLYALILRGAADYDVDDYVQDGLVAHFDGIRNAGADAAHNPSAATWKNLVAGQPDMVFTNSPGAWTNGNSYYFNQRSTAYGQLESGVTLGQYATVQLAVDVTASEQYSSRNAYPTYFYGPTDGKAFSLYSQGRTPTVSFRGGYYFDGDNSDPAHSLVNSWGGLYLTAILGDGMYYAFEGVEYSNGKTRGASAKSLPEFQYMFGGFDTANRAVKGAYYNVRLYTNTLDNAQLAQNRRVDEIRFHGNGDVTVVNGTIGDTGANGESSLTDGVYNIEAGTWTITAPEVRSDGHTYQPKLLVEIYNATIGEWVATTAKPQLANSYTIDKSALGNGRIRLTWTWQIRKGFIISIY